MMAMVIANISDMNVREVLVFDQVSLDKVSKRGKFDQCQCMEGSTVEVERRFLKFIAAAIGGSSDQRCIFGHF